MFAGRNSSKLHPAVLAMALAFVSTAASAAPTAEGLLAQGRVDDAIHSLEQKIDNAPNDAESHNLLCRAYFLLENWDAGIRDCQKAVALDSTNSQYHMWLGRLYGQKASHSTFLIAAGLAKKVRTEFETAVRLDPANRDARADLAEFYVEAPGIVGGGEDKAEVQAEALARLDPPEAELVRAWIQEKNKDFPGAESHYRSAAGASPTRAGAWLSLAQFYGRTGHLGQMQDALDHALAAQNRSSVLMAAAEIFMHGKRDLRKAIELLHQYLAARTIEDAPAFKAHYLLGTAFEQSGNTAAAADEYRAALSLAKDFTLAQSALDRVTREVSSRANPR
jgi:tetratricopeptide (TPR) repeat protein